VYKVHILLLEKTTALSVSLLSDKKSPQGKRRGDPWLMEVLEVKKQMPNNTYTTGRGPK